jgi:hypothetical protein
VLVVQALAGVLLEMQALDADGARAAVFEVEDDLALADDRLLILGDLVAGRQVGVEVVLALEHRDQVDLGPEGQPGSHGLGDARLVRHRQHAGHGRVDERDLAVRLGPEGVGGAREQLCLGDHLGVHLEPDDRLPRAGFALDESHAGPPLLPRHERWHRVEAGGAFQHLGRAQHGFLVEGTAD